METENISNNQNNLINLERTAFTLHKCHNNQAFLCKVYNEFIVISTILVSSFITIFIPLINNYEGEESRSTQITNSILGFYISFITALSRFYNPAEKFQIYKTTSRDYLSLKYTIRQRIISSSSENIIQSINDSIKDLEELRENSPFISDKLYNKFYKEAIY